MNNNKIFYAIITAPALYSLIPLANYVVKVYGSFSLSYFLSNFLAFNNLIVIAILTVPNILLYVASKMTSAPAFTNICIILGAFFSLIYITLMSVPTGGAGLPVLAIFQILLGIAMIVIGGIVNVSRREGL